MIIPTKLTNPNAILPRYSSAGAGAMDFFAAHDGYSYEVIDTGVAMAIPDGFTLFMFSRSGHGFNHDLRLCNSVGVIDSDYRGSIKVKFTQGVMSGNMLFRAGDKVAQGIIMETPRITLNQVAELDATVRGDNGFGSTGQ